MTFELVGFIMWISSTIHAVPNVHICHCATDAKGTVCLWRENKVRVCKTGSKSFNDCIPHDNEEYTRVFCTKPVKEKK